MRYGSALAHFDLTDVENPVDSTSSILDDAVEVLEEYGGEDRTRITRLARWIVHNAAAVVDEVRAGGISKFDVGEFSVWRVGGHVGLGPRDDAHECKKLEPEEVRELITALLRATERAEAL